MSDKKTEIIDLPIKLKYPITVGLNKGINKAKFCNHWSIEIDEHNRSVHCGGTVDAFEWVQKIANQEQHQTWQFQEIKRQVEVLTKMRDELERKCNNLKSQIRNAEKKLKP